MRSNWKGRLGKSFCFPFLFHFCLRNRYQKKSKVLGDWFVCCQISPYVVTDIQSRRRQGEKDNLTHSPMVAIERSLGHSNQLLHHHFHFTESLPLARLSFISRISLVAALVSETVVLDRSFSAVLCTDFRFLHLKEIL